MRSWNKQTNKQKPKKQPTFPCPPQCKTAAGVSKWKITAL